MRIQCICEQCKNIVEFECAGRFTCVHCHNDLLAFATEDFLASQRLNQCPVCGCAHLYRQKDFNRKIGVAILMLGIALAYFTYGASLLFVTIIDWLLYRQVKEIGCCYTCGSVFRNGATIKQLDSFNLGLHDYYKNLKGGEKSNL